MLSRNDIETIRLQYPKGTQIRLIQMANDPHPIPAGSVGVVDLVDDIGQIHAIWPDGRRLAVIPGIDDFCKASPKSMKKEKPKHRSNARE